MLRIRSEQVPAIAPGSPAFIEQMVGFLRAHFPAECDGLDDVEMRAVVRHGVEKAASYGIDAQQDICKLLNLMCTFGLDFDRDPALPWAREHLADARRRGPTLQVNRLLRTARKHMDRARGLAATPTAE